VQLRGARISLRLLFRLWSKNHPRKPAPRCRIHALRYEAINGSDPLPSSAIFRAQLKSQGIECLAASKVLLLLDDFRQRRAMMSARTLWAAFPPAAA